MGCGGRVGFEGVGCIRVGPGIDLNGLGIVPGWVRRKLPWDEDQKVTEYEKRGTEQKMAAL